MALHISSPIMHIKLGRTVNRGTEVTMLTTAAALLLVHVVNSFAGEVCYPPCGCFSDDPPFDHVPLPQRPESGIGGQNLRWQLYTPRNPDTPIMVHYDDTQLPSEYDGSARTVFLMHGWNANPRTMESTKNAYLNSGKNYNVIILDWSRGQGIRYWLCSSNARVAGACSAHLARMLAQFSGSENLDNFQCVGHSLGAQACGFMGKFTNGTIGRVTGMDPAGPWFKKDDPRVRIDKDDGQFVDIMHTSGGRIALGLYKQIGDVDFYPNKGFDQPPCMDLVVKGSCDHNIVGAYFRASLTAATANCTFTAYPCQTQQDADDGLCEVCEEGVDCQKMGHYAETMPGRGTYYLRTEADAPYCEN